MHFMFKRKELCKRNISPSDVTVLQLLQGQCLAAGRESSFSELGQLFSLNALCLLIFNLKYHKAT